MRSIYAIILAILLLATGCSDSYCPSLDKVVTVEERDFYEISLSELNPKEINLGLMGIIGARYCDSLLVVTTLGTGCFTCTIAIVWSAKETFSPRDEDRKNCYFHYSEVL